MATQAALTWIKQAQDVDTSGGVRYWFDLATNDWSATDYQEVTGYIIESMLRWYDATGEADLRTRAIAMADWVVSVQLANGSWLNYAFETGMIISGLIDAYTETADADYLAAAVKAGDWLVTNQQVDGTWIVDYRGIAHSYHARIDWALLKLWQATGDLDYKTAAISNLEWVLTQQNAVGWFANCGIEPGEHPNPLTHTLFYTAEGLLESGLILNDADYINAAILTADNVLPLQTADGSLTGGYYHDDWSVHTAANVMTGEAQISIIWWRLYNYTEDEKYLTAARKSNVYLRQKQCKTPDLRLNGGIFGSDPEGIAGTYYPNTILSWAVKFFLDAMYYESLYG